jgi:hypothetical protein
MLPRTFRSGWAVRKGRPGAVVVAAMVTVVSLGTPSAGSAAPLASRASSVPASMTAPVGGSPGELIRLEARAAKLAKQYRGQLVQLTDAETAARAAMANGLRLRHQLGDSQLELARLAAASYMDGVHAPAAAILGNGDPQRRLEDLAIIDYLARQRSAQEQQLEGFMAAEQRAEQAARAEVSNLRRLVEALVSQRHRVSALIARFQPQSPVTGDSITPRMHQVKDEIDRRFGPFPGIGCYRPGTDGEHPLGRACDFMLSTGGVLPSAANVRRGYNVAAWAQANAARLGIMYIIYRQRIWDIRMASSGWVEMADRGGITANHFDHVHISVF